MSLDRQLENCHNLAQALGGLETAVKAYVHVGGILGKTSTVRFLSRIVKSCTPLRIGSFVHPAIIAPRDCIRIGDEGLGLGEYEALRDRVDEALLQLTVPVTEYERLFTIALLAFKMHQCDLVIVESAFGGVFDATTVLTKACKDTKQLAAVMTRIALDHVQHLGSTLSAITANISGIIRPSVPVVLSKEQPAEVLHTLRSLGIRIASPVQTFGPLDVNQFFTRMPLHQQGLNMELAMRTYQLIAPELEALFGVTCRRPMSGLLAELLLSHTFAELYCGRGKLIVDAAQNSAANLCSWLRHAPLQEQDKVHLVIGMVDKADEVIRDFFRSFGLRPQYHYSLVGFTSPRGYPWIHAAERDKLKKLLLEVYDDPKDASPPSITNLSHLAEVLAEDLGASDMVVVCGSPHIVHEFYHLTLPHERHL